MQTTQKPKVFDDPEETMKWILSDLPGDETNNTLSMSDLPSDLGTKIDFS